MREGVVCSIEDGEGNVVYELTEEQEAEEEAAGGMVPLEALGAYEVYRDLVAREIWQPRLVHNFMPILPPMVPRNAPHYEQLFCDAISNTENHLHLLLIAEDIRQCHFLPKEMRDNLLYNISLRL